MAEDDLRYLCWNATIHVTRNDVPNTVSFLLTAFNSTTSKWPFSKEAQGVVGLYLFWAEQIYILHPKQMPLKNFRTVHAAEHADWMDIKSVQWLVVEIVWWRENQTWTHPEGSVTSDWTISILLSCYKWMFFFIMLIIEIMQANSLQGWHEVRIVQSNYCCGS